MSWDDRNYGGGGGRNTGLGGLSGGGRFADNPLTWAPKIGSVAGIRIRIHILFILFIAFRLITEDDGPIVAAHWLLILFGSVFLHELGHCFAARAMKGTADEVLMWPLGGLAFVDVVRRPWPQFVTVIWGPMVNVGFVILTGALLAVGVAGDVTIPWNPLLGFVTHPEPWLSLQAWLMMVFQINLFLALFNMYPMYPMDAGRMLQCALWPRLGYARSTLITTTVGMVASIAMGLYALSSQTWLLLGIAVMGYLVCYQERLLVKSGARDEEGFMGHDFSGGYATLRGDKPKREGIMARRKRKREDARLQAAEQASAVQQDEVDRILAKVHEKGITSLTRREKRTLEEATESQRTEDQHRV